MHAAGRWAQRAILLVLLLWTNAAFAQEPDGSRVALVIGNANYLSVTPLRNPVNDAEAVGEAFRRLGFDVTTVTDLDYATMRGALQDFEEQVATADVAVVYFAGHGIEMGGTNFLIPVDAELKRDIHLWDEAIRLERVLLAVESAATLRLVILDACRDNPFAGQMELTDPSRSIGRGLALFEPPTRDDGSTILAFAARQGTVAADGDGDHSPFTAALLSHLETPGLEVSFVFRNVRDDVMASTGGVQEPMITSSLGREQIFFADPGAIVAPPVSLAQDPADDQGSIVAAYQAAVAIDTIEAWQTFLRYYPEGLYADLARAALNKLRDESPGGNDALLPPDTEPELPVFVGVDDPAGEAAAACDREAAYRYDPDRPAEVAPVAEHLVVPDTALDACRLAVELNPNDRRLLFQMARVADIAGNETEALDAARAAASLGSASAMALVGRYYEEGRIVATDVATAIDWYQRAVEGGSSDGMVELGYLYDSGTGVTLDLAEAGAWFDRAAEAGNAAGMAAIGYRYRNGRGVDADQAEARSWYQRAAEAGDGFAMQELAFMLEYGEGGPVDLAAAARWYEEAAERDFAFAMMSLGYLHEVGAGVAPDIDASRRWYERAAAAGDAIAMFALGRIYEFGIGVERDYEQAFAWYAQAAITGEMPAALTRMGVFHSKGRSVEQDYSTARSLWEEAALAGDDDALLNLGYLYQAGQGVPTDLERAARYYIEALSLGSESAVAYFSTGDHPGAIRRAIEGYLIGEGLMSGKPDGFFDEATFAAFAALTEG